MPTRSKRRKKSIRRRKKRKLSLAGKLFLSAVIIFLLIPIFSLSTALINYLSPSPVFATAPLEISGQYSVVVVVIVLVVILVVLGNVSGEMLNRNREKKRINATSESILNSLKFYDRSNPHPSYELGGKTYRPMTKEDWDL